MAYIYMELGKYDLLQASFMFSVLAVISDNEAMHFYSRISMG